MKKINKGLLGIFAGTLAAALTAVSAAAYSPGYESGYIGEAVYYDTADGDLVIKDGVLTAYTGSSAAVTIPSTVTSIGSKAFYNNTKITSIKLHNGVTSIGDRAFYGCSKLSSADLGTGLTSIGESAFSGCSQLTAISVPNGVTELSVRIFYGCSALKDISVPENLTAIGNYAFDGCTSLDGDIILPDGLKTLGLRAFAVCSEITSVTIPSSLVSMANTTFSGCTKLKNVYYKGSQTQWAAVSGTGGIPSAASIHYSSDGNEGESGGASSETTDQNGFVIKNGVLTAYKGSATRVSIPDTVTAIGSKAFKDCTGLIGVTIPKTVTEIGSEAFSGCTGLYVATIPNGVTSVGKSAYEGCTKLSGVSIAASVTSIGEKAFYGCTALTSVYYTGSEEDWNDPAKIQKGDNAIPAGVTVKYKETSGGGADYDTGAFVITDGVLTEYKGVGGDITIPRAAVRIGESAFKDCESITSVIIQTGTVSVGGNAFSGCVNLIGVSLPSGMTEVGESAFEGCSGLKKIYLPNTLLKLGNKAFSGCSSLESASLSIKLTEIGEEAFSGCIKLKNITVPGSVTKVGDRAFSGCEELEALTALGGVETIGEQAFSGCVGLKSAAVADGVKTIKARAFENCIGMIDMTLPKSLTAIGEGAFGSCSALEIVNYVGSQSDWENITKGENAVPEGVEINYECNLIIGSTNTVVWVNGGKGFKTAALTTSLSASKWENSNKQSKSGKLAWLVSLTPDVPEYDTLTHVLKTKTDKTAATVSSKGVVTAKSAGADVSGENIVYVFTTDSGSMRSEINTVYVKNAPSAVTLTTALTSAGKASADKKDKLKTLFTEAGGGEQKVYLVPVCKNGHVSPDCTYTVTVDKKNNGNITVGNVEADEIGNQFLTVKGLKANGNKAAKIKVTVMCDQSGKKVSFTVSVTSPIEDITTTVSGSLAEKKSQLSMTLDYTYPVGNTASTDKTAVIAATNTPSVNGKKITFTKSKTVSASLKNGTVTLKSSKGVNSAQAIYIKVTDAATKLIKVKKIADISEDGTVTAATDAEWIK